MIPGRSIEVFPGRIPNEATIDDSLFPRPPPEPPDVEFLFDLEPNSGEVFAAVVNNIVELNEDECFDPGGFNLTMIEVFRVRFVVPVHKSFASFVCN
uniref:Reverse transcriptase domain-containing protein n=1 Tax=Tanacetum cinerariifolium TaxID=118510 RepID=A0A6L2JH66_TANCI|nr:hypothetical protein [Tanacetum cinerariifolium]